MKKEKILIIEDEKNIADVIKAYLEKEGYGAYHAPSGKSAYGILENTDIDFIILDLMLPDLPGEEICREIRSKSQIPILMLTAKTEEADRIRGLNLGADDYLTKPFSPRELVARVKAILRRTYPEPVQKNILDFNGGDLVIDGEKRQARKGGKPLNLTATEFKILKILSHNEEKVFTREELIVGVLGYDYDGYDRTIDTHIKNLRQKIETNKKYIHTVYGLGYKFSGE